MKFYIIKSFGLVAMCFCCVTIAEGRTQMTPEQQKAHHLSVWIDAYKYQEHQYPKRLADLNVLVSREDEQVALTKIQKAYAFVEDAPVLSLVRQPAMPIIAMSFTPLTEGKTLGRYVVYIHPEYGASILLAPETEIASLMQKGSLRFNEDDVEWHASNVSSNQSKLIDAPQPKTVEPIVVKETASFSEAKSSSVLPIVPAIIIAALIIGTVALFLLRRK